GLELPAAAQAILDLGCRTVVVTFGRGVARRPWMAAAETIGEGALRHQPKADPPASRQAQGEELPIVCWVVSGEGRWVLPALPTHAGPIVDATGAGDAFAAGFLWGLLAGEPLPRCASLGHVAAGFCITSMGCRAGLPTREALVGRHARYFR
ncbi:MAG: PfkB family carbohydrate kinase, partial [Chloroflexota bacterium]|nr:PfkB family carbohydrate kinase [Chloroflexota bacterium]